MASYIFCQWDYCSQRSLGLTMPCQKAYRRLLLIPFRYKMKNRLMNWDKSNKYYTTAGRSRTTSPWQKQCKCTKQKVHVQNLPSESRGSLCSEHKFIMPIFQSEKDYSLKVNSVPQIRAFALQNEKFSTKNEQVWRADDHTSLYCNPTNDYIILCNSQGGTLLIMIFTSHPWEVAIKTLSASTLPSCTDLQTH